MVVFSIANVNQKNDYFRQDIINFSGSRLIVNSITIESEQDSGDMFACFNSSGQLFRKGTACT